MRTITGEETNSLRRQAVYKKENQQEGPEHQKKMSIPCRSLQFEHSKSTVHDVRICIH
ncbi:hypothetical protein C0J52_20020 [Blattella germanica]|nr:hypothetical protein C0J52_20020 [Blattella germanica]